MGMNEKTPLKGSEEHVPYVFMTDPNRAYKKKVRQLQCYLCSGIIAVFALALLVSVAYSVDMEDEDETPINGSLALNLKSSKQDVSTFMEDANDFIIKAGHLSSELKSNGLRTNLKSDDVDASLESAGLKSTELETNSLKSTLKSDDYDALFMDSKNLHLEKASGKANISKKATSFTVDVANVTATVGENIIFQSYYQTFPIEMPLDDVADTTAYTPSADITFSATYENDILIGTASIPLKKPKDLLIIQKEVLVLDFVAAITIKWSGTLELTSKKNYKCKLMFQSYAKLSEESPLKANKMASENDIIANNDKETCSILLVGTYYHRPFYCPVTPWWCSEGTIYYWSGEAKLIFTKPLPPSVPALKNMVNAPTSLKSSFGPGMSGFNIQIMKSFIGLKVISGQVSWQNSDAITNTVTGSPPIKLNLTTLLSPHTFDRALDITFKANQAGDELINGTFTIPIHTNKDGIMSTQTWNANFSLEVEFSNNVDGSSIVPNKEYNCKLLFQERTSKSLINEQSSPFGESCFLKISGSSIADNGFLCSGDIELILNYKYNNSVAHSPAGISKEVDLPEKNQFELSLPLKQSASSNAVLGKTEDFVITKTFASVTVLKGKITGQFNGEEATSILDGSPPVYIYLDNFINPNAFDVSLQATWQATPVDDSSVVGTFSVPYFPSLGDTTDRRKFTANFSVDIIYKYGGSIGIIDPSKTYSCKVMFQGNKKLSSSKLSLTTVSRPVLNKTPFGESCTITVSGSFYEPSMFCFWCSNENIFQWYGDIELALKNKQNITNNNTNENKLQNTAASLPKMLVHAPKNSLGTGEIYPSDYNEYGHRIGGKVLSGWIKTNNGGIFSGTTTVWSGDLPFEIKFPLFWTPSNDDGSELSTVYSHAILWSASIFHSTVQGSFSFPQYVGHGPPPNLKWISGTFSFQLGLDSKISLYDLIVPGVKYNSNLHYHNLKSLDKIPFENPTKKVPTQEDISYGIHAPIILLGKYASGGKSFIWNGTFVIVFSKTTKDLTYG